MHYASDSGTFASRKRLNAALVEKEAGPGFKRFQCIMYRMRAKYLRMYDLEKGTRILYCERLAGKLEREYWKPFRERLLKMRSYIYNKELIMLRRLIDISESDSSLWI